MCDFWIIGNIVLLDILKEHGEHNNNGGFHLRIGVSSALLENK